MQKTILIISGTGMLGQPVARRLKESGFGVRVMTRNLQKAKEMFDSTYEIFAGDPTDINCVEEALNGCYGVHISLPSEVEQQVAETVAQVASRHGVERISYISGATVAEEHRWVPIANRKFLAEQAIRERDSLHHPLPDLGHGDFADVREPGSGRCFWKAALSLPLGRCR
ncbi:MAG: hypothetical protein EHM33_34475 [Chloroflexi bacterium]|nr:MAG: hypothetical protein EHM33_34475 [Chloroflexota bacterium]